MRCTRSRGPRGFFCLHDFRRGPVNVAVITLSCSIARDNILADQQRLTRLADLHAESPAE